MTSEVGSDKDTRPGNEVIRALLDFNSSDEEVVDYDKKLDEMVIPNNKHNNKHGELASLNIKRPFYSLDFNLDSSHEANRNLSTNGGTTGNGSSPDLGAGSVAVSPSSTNVHLPNQIPERHVIIPRSVSYAHQYPNAVGGASREIEPSIQSTSDSSGKDQLLNSSQSNSVSALSKKFDDDLRFKEENSAKNIKRQKLNDDVVDLTGSDEEGASARDAKRLYPVIQQDWEDPHATTETVKQEPQLRAKPAPNFEVIDLSDISDTDDGESTDDNKNVGPLKQEPNVKYEVSRTENIENDDDDDDDDDEIQIIEVKTRKQPDNFGGMTIEQQLLENRIKALEQAIPEYKDSYNNLAQRLIEKKTHQRKLAENISSLKKLDAQLSTKDDPVSKNAVASGRAKIKTYSFAYNEMVRQTLDMEKVCEEKRRAFLNSKMNLARLKQERSHSSGYHQNNNMNDYNAAYESAIMSASEPHWEAPRGYSSNVYTDDNTSLGTLLNNIKPDEAYVEGQAKTPEGLAVSLLPHQRIGLAWLEDMEKSTNKGGILADDMGLGKTVQLLALMLLNRSKDPNRKTNLIVAPIALLKQWAQEIASKVRPSDEMTVFIYHQQDKLKSFEAMKQYDVVLVSYNTLASEMKKHYAMAIEQAKLAHHSSVIPDRGTGGQVYVSPFFTSDAIFHRIILDEAQWIKNKLTQASKSVSLLESDFRWCLSGTPMQNSIDELFPLIRFLRIKPYVDEDKFKADISLPIKSSTSERYDSFDKKRALRKVQALLKATTLRRTKESQVDGKPILSLPEKTIKVEDVMMQDAERDYYKNLESNSAQKADRLMSQKGAGVYSSILTLLLRLRQACCHKYLVELGDRKASDYDPSKVPLHVIRSLETNVVKRIQSEVEIGFTCPICFDTVANEKIAFLAPCGHALCQDCIFPFFERFQINGDEEEGSRIASCITCRAKIKENLVFNYDLFDLIFNKNYSDERIKAGFTYNFQSNKKADRRRNLLRIIEEHGGFENSAKIDLCVSTIENLLSASHDEKIIVFSQFTLLFEVIRILMDEKKIPFLQYDGSMSADDRNAVISQFYKDPTQRVMLLSLRAGNVGLTLTCANHVIIMDPFWNPFVEEQAMDRAHRIGQQREVHVHRLLIKDTVEDRILQLQKEKKELIEGALDPEGLSNVSRLGRNEIRFLFGLGSLNERN